ncbi:MAG: AAA family ATPase, partial [Chloroflexota bacterium]|nr:AAA family ATPase [Chloroflexota bacterium]
VTGVLIHSADQAREVDHPVVLVVDEMNRANLPSVFGELLYLLEYREKEVRLLRRSKFSLPKNLYLIGSMNTADRSIRSIDSALRRRFDIIECSPSAQILEAYYEEPSHSNEVQGLIEGMNSLNQELATSLDRHHTVGHTYFMQEHFDQNELKLTWTRQVQPLIEEYFFDQPDIAESFSMERFWPE